MSTDGLYYLPDGFRESGRGSADTADAAESSRRYLGQATANSASYAGADAFVGSLNGTRDRQVREVDQAAEGRENMAESDYQVAAGGEEMDADANAALGLANPSYDPSSPVARSISDGV
ncbi:hypothetical protein [Streptomyces triticirhizae]|uniref:Uncharacterized protein n=1 Tax=Streptomyces triticirhizae TaxID=2483353 RepID=A0A3M2KWP9_9ACTN|nr:hypothetical protein [Streptomyces triticirhizae]RMI29997.1 hypothetical protein EBN88_27090 [Streptomyces triticirhizae]